MERGCYGASHLHTAAHLRGCGLLKGPLFIRPVPGLRGGAGAHHEDLLHMKRTADRLFGKASISRAGRPQAVDSSLGLRPL